MDTFNGFGNGTIDFLADLRANNDKAWFDANRDRYEAHWLEPARAFVEAAGEALGDLAPGVVAEPRINGSMFRINRDIRFSKDKTPYKDHLDLWFWDGCERRDAVTGFYVRITPDEVGIGVGAHGFDRDRLSRYRDLVLDPDAGAALKAAVGAVRKAGMTVEGEHYKRPPRGVDEPDDDDLANLLRFNALWAHETAEHPRVLGSKRFLTWCVTRWRKQLPLHEWLRDNLQT